MKKIIGLVIFILSFSCTQLMAQSSDTKIKRTTTTRDKVHNVFHPKHKKYHGYKYKHTSGHHKRKVEVKSGKTTIETKQ